jgi:hypothetical protein
LKKQLLIPLLCAAILASASAQSPNYVPLYPFSFQGKWGVVGPNRSVVFEPQCEQIGLFDWQREDDLYSQFAIAKLDNKYGILNEKMEWKVPAKYDSIAVLLYHKPGPVWFKFKQDGQWGILTWKMGRVNVSTYSAFPQFDEIAAAPYQKDMAIVKKDGKYGALKLGQWKPILPLEYDELSVDFYFYELNAMGSTLGPWFKASQGSSTAYFKLDGSPKTGTPLTKEAMKARVDLEMGVGLGGSKPINYHSRSRPLGQGKWQVEIYPDNQPGKVLLSTEVSGPDSIVRAIGLGWPPKFFGHIVAKKDGLVGVINHKGEAMTGYVYDEIEDALFEKIVRRNGLFGLLNRNFDQVVPPVFSKIERVSDALYLVEHPAGYTGYLAGDSLYLPQPLTIAYPPRSVPYPISDSDKVEYTIDPSGLAVFPGGRRAMIDYFEKNSQIPFTIVPPQGSYGASEVRFIVEKDGNLSGYELHMVSNVQKAELDRLFEAMPRPWKPAVSNGHIVRWATTVYLRFLE